MKRINLIIVFGIYLSTALNVVAQQANGPTKTEALLNISVVNYEDKPEHNAQIKVSNRIGTFSAQGTTDVDGHLLMLLPMGDTFDFSVLKYDTVFSFKNVAVPEREFGFKFPVKFRIKVVTMEYINISDIFLFYPDRGVEMDDAAKSKLQGLMIEMKNKPGVKIEIGGHADPEELLDNQKERISKRRAENVADYFKANGIEGSRVKVIDYKSEKPIQTVGSSVDNPNRHVEIKVVAR